MRAVERLFKQHDSRLKKIANVFAWKSRGTIEKEEFYQEFAVRLLELNIAYRDKPAEEFVKILNFSLHNLACDMLRSRFRNICVGTCDTLLDSDSGYSVDKTSTIATVMVPSFLYFYKQAAYKLIQNETVIAVFDWLVDNPDVVEKIREEKNLFAIRHRRVAMCDLVLAICTQFNCIPNVARQHIRVIKNSLKVVWSLEGIA